MTTAINRPARVGLITDQTGALSFMGIANVNVAKMVIDDINARGGLLGRPVELFIEDSATDDDVAEAAAAKLVERAAVDVVVGGIYSSTRQAIKRPVVDQAETLYIYPEQYEGQECHPLIFCTGPVPAQQVEPFFPWLMQQTGAKRFYLPSADYIWPHTMNKKVREVVTAEGGEIVGEEYFPLDHTDYERVVEDIMATGAEVVFNTIVPPGLTPFLEQLHRAGFTARGGHIVCTYFDENFLNLVPADHVEGLYGCLDYYRDVDDPFSIELLNRYEGSLPRERDVHRGECVHGNVPSPQALGGRRQRSRVPEPGGRHRGARPRPDRAGSGRPRRDGSGPAPRADEHVHRPVRGRHVQGGEEPRSHRPEGVRGRTDLTPTIGVHPDMCRGGAGSDHRAGAALSLQELGDVRQRLRVLVHEEVTALVAAELGVGDATGDGLAVRPGRHAVVRTARDERGRRDASQPRPHVVAAAGDDLHPLAPLLLVGLRCGEARP